MVFVYVSTHYSWIRWLRVNSRWVFGGYEVLGYWVCLYPTGTRPWATGFVYIQRARGPELLGLFTSNGHKALSYWVCLHLTGTRPWATDIGHDFECGWGLSLAYPIIRWVNEVNGNNLFSNYFPAFRKEAMILRDRIILPLNWYNLCTHNSGQCVPKSFFSGLGRDLADSITNLATLTIPWFPVTQPVYYYPLYHDHDRWDQSQDQYRRPGCW